MFEKFRLDRKIVFQNMLSSKCISVIIDSIGPSIILRSILDKVKRHILWYILQNISVKDK